MAMLEWRLARPEELPGPALELNMVAVGRLPDGRTVYDCCGAPAGIGEVMAEGPRRREQAPHWVRRQVTIRHRWTGERDV